MKYFKSEVIAVFLWLGLITGFTACPASPTSQSPNSAAYNSNQAVVINTTNTNSANTNTQITTGNTKMADNLRKNLDETIQNWCPEHQDYTRETELKRIWVESGKHPWDYMKDGVKGDSGLIARIQSHEFFKNCPNAGALKPNLFDTGGVLQTFGKLYDELYECDPDNR